jgi:PAS domain S-box-containing protein
LPKQGARQSGFTAAYAAANTPPAPNTPDHPVVLGHALNLLGEPSYHAVARIQHPQLNWELHAYISEAEIAAQATRQQQSVMRQAMFAGSLTLVITALISLGLASSITLPIRRLAEFLEDIEKSGDLWQRPPSTEQRSSAEIRGIYAAVDRFLQTLATQRMHERKQQAQLTEDQQRLLELSHFNDTLLSAISEHALVSLTDINGRITYVNERFQQITQYPSSELLGQTHAFVLSKQHDPDFYANLWDTIGTGRIWHGEICNSKKDGTLFWVEAAIVPNRNEMGEFVGFTAVSMDITERKQDATRMHASLSTLRALLETIPYPVFLKDTQSHYVECNDAFCDMIGKPRNDLLGKTPHEVSPKAFADSYIEADQALYNSPAGQQVYENSVINAAGQIREVMFHKRVHLGLNGKPEGLVGIAIDVTEFRNTERELRHHRDRLQELVDERTADLTHAKNEAERANHAKSEFLANITHELRTPLHAIISFTRLAQSHLKRSEIEDVPEFLDDVYLASQRQLNLVNDLLDLSKVEAGRMTLSMTRQSVQTLLEASVRGVTPLLANKSLQLTWQIETLHINADVDSTRMQQVFANLLSNAIKFSPEGGQLLLRLCDDELPAGRRESDPLSLPALRIELKDHGVGIPEEDLESIFDKFVQSRRTNSGSGGTGLGLAICREIVTLHGGRIHATNNPEGGSTFSLLIPRPAPLGEA